MIQTSSTSVCNLDAVNIYYKNYLAETGGIETMTYNLAYKYASKKDILFLIGSGDPKQIQRLKEVGRVEMYNPNKQYYCKKVFITYETFVPKNIHAEHRARVSHGDLVECTSHGWDIPKDPTITEDYGVSRNTCETVKIVMGKDAIYCPNPFIQEPVKPLLKLISPQRMTWEKGAGRIKEVARRLDEKRIPYQWLIFCDHKEDVEALDNPNLIWVKSRLNIKPYIQDADYLVLLSDNEGAAMSPQEALMLGTPIIVTDLPCYKDLNIDSNYGFLVKKDLSDLDVEEVYDKKNKFFFKWLPPKDIWGDILLNGKSKRRNSMKEYKVIATDKYEKMKVVDSTLGYIPKELEKFIVPENRLDVLLGDNAYGIKFIFDKYEEVKREEPKEEKVEKKKGKK